MEIARSDGDLRIPTERTEKRAPHDTKQGSDTTEEGR
ncbi:MAG: hypothetical protein KatS3mg076_3290 [Candidatus Binatia bacterium]|nr:MAG: hypothetical protein KatS3mg076_3290 [Candidatus Binatia bacterium]